MTTQLDPTLLPALDAIFGAAAETEDFHRRVFREQCAREAKLRALVQPRIEERDDPRDAEQYYLEQQSPSEGTFR